MATQITYTKLRDDDAEVAECRGCRRILPLAADQTDAPPVTDEVILDAAGETEHRNYYVCGDCWDSGR